MNNNRNNIPGNTFGQPSDGDRKVSGVTIPGAIQRGRRISAANGAPLPLLVSHAELEANYQQFYTLVIEAEQAYHRVETTFREDEQRYHRAEQHYLDILQQYQAAETSYITASNEYQYALKAKSQNSSVFTNQDAAHREYRQAREAYQEAIETCNALRENSRAARETYRNSMQTYQEVEETYQEILHLSHKAREAYVEHLETGAR